MHRRDPHPSDEINVAHLSPARYTHINPYGKYRFNVEEEFFRRLRQPNSALAQRCFLSTCCPIVDATGNLAYFVIMNNAQTGSVNVAFEKAHSARLFKYPTKDFQDTLEPAFLA